ncbi:MAG: DNA (cytosine-5-)-methyltransferase, partial [Acidimicrobiia bacterium]
SRREDPGAVLFAKDAGDPFEPTTPDLPRGFYWTEGNSGLGWAVDAVPTLKGGSAIGIPSPPAIWWPETGFIGMPAIEDAERLQGFRAGTTSVDVEEKSISRGDRWRLVGNSVSVPVAKWVGDKLVSRGTHPEVTKSPLNGKWPSAAVSGDRPGGRRWSVNVSEWPTRPHEVHLDDFLLYEPTSLSARATLGFMRRLKGSGLNYEKRFLAALERHAKTQSESLEIAVARS